MNTKKITFWLLILCFIGLGAGFILTNSIKFDICVVNEVTTDASCINFYERIGNPLFYGMSVLALVFLVLTFVPQAFSAWKKFAVWFIPIAALLFIFYPDPGSGDYFSPYPEQIFQWVSILYIVISVVIIGRSLVGKGKKKTS